GGTAAATGAPGSPATLDAGAETGRSSGVKLRSAKSWPSAACGPLSGGRTVESAARSASACAGRAAGAIEREARQGSARPIVRHTVLLRPVCRRQLDVGQLELVALEVELALLDVVLRARDVVFGPQALPAGDDLAVDARGVLVERQVAGSFELVHNRHAFGGRAQTDLAGSVLADGLRVVELGDRRGDEEALAAGQLGDDDRVRRRARTEGLPSVDRVDLRARHELLEVVRGRGLAFAAVAAQVLRREDVRV